MTEPSFFKTPFDKFIQHESLRLYQEQIATKRAHLNTAQSAYQKSSELVEEFKNKITLVGEQITVIDKTLATSEDSQELEKLNLEKNRYEQFIEKANKQLTPYVQRLNQLTQNIHTLEEEIKSIEDQERDLIKHGTNTHLEP